MPILKIMFLVTTLHAQLIYMHDFVNSHKSPIRQLLSGCPFSDKETETDRGDCHLPRVTQLIKCESRDLNQSQGDPAAPAFNPNVPPGLS